MVGGQSGALKETEVGGGEGRVARRGEGEGWWGGGRWGGVKGGVTGGNDTVVVT